MTGPGPWAGKGNDFRGILGREPGPPPDIAVIVPPGNDTARAAVESQEYDGRLVIVDASDTDDLARATDCDVVVVAGEGVPEAGWLETHARWHRRAENVVVLGPNSDPARNRMIRGSRLLLGNDEGFAALTPDNVSLPAAAWAHHRDLDIRSGWKLWNDGFFFAYEPEATTSGDSGVARAPAGAGDELTQADTIPHRRFRTLPSAFHTTPKVSWVVAVDDVEEARRAWATCQQSTYADHEIIFHGPPSATAEFQSLASANPRVSAVQGDTGRFRAAIAQARGELVALLDPRAAIAPETLTKAMSRFEAKPSAPVVRVGYDMEGSRYLRLDDLAAIDAHIGRNGLPLFAVVTRRELSKDPSALDHSQRAWSDALARCEQTLVISPLVRVADPVPFDADTPGLRELAATGVAEVAREVVRTARRRRAASEESEMSEAIESDDRLSVAYVGFTGHDNLGDEAVRVAIERLMPWARFAADPPDPSLLMVGGGTLINGRRYYLNRMLRQESASVERALFGTGVRSPEYWGITEPMDDWFSFIDSSLFAAVRGPDSVRNLKTLGYRRDLPVIGDPALYLEAPDDVERVAGRVVVCPVYTSGNLHGGDDDAVFGALAGLIARLRSEGREVVMLSAFPQDDRWAIDIMRRAKAPDLPYVAGYADIDDTMRVLGSADLVVGERLHAAIMAAAAGTPFVGVEYRPKLRDFARSVDQEDAIVRTDQMALLDEVCDSILAEREKVKADLERHVSRYRRLQAEAAESLRQSLQEPDQP